MKSFSRFPQSSKEVYEDVALMVGRRCQCLPYSSEKIRSVSFKGLIEAYASPDSTYAVTARYFRAAKKSILIGIYDFSSESVKSLLVDAMKRGVAVSLMLDVDSAKEKVLFQSIARYGAECVPAPSCASDYVHYFPSSHEKVIIIDDEVVLIQSGNYSDNSIPVNGDGKVDGTFRPGNRDTGVAIHSKALAKLFTRVLRADMKLETDAERTAAALSVRNREESVILSRRPAKVPPLVPSKKFRIGSPLTLIPVLSPDNYMEVVPLWLKNARKSVVIEQQYIRKDQSEVEKLIQAIQSAKETNPALVVKIILAPPIMPKPAETSKLRAEMKNLTDRGFEVRLLSHDYYVHCHNKMIVIDNREVLISSQNWSDFAVSRNREAGIIIPHVGVARYFASLFENDWKTAILKLPAGAGLSRVGTALAGDYVEVELADVQDI